MLVLRPALMEIDDIRSLYERMEDFLSRVAQIPDGREEEDFTPELRQESEDLIREGTTASMECEDEGDAIEERKSWGQPSFQDSDEERDEERDESDTLTLEDNLKEDLNALAEEREKVEELTRPLEEARSILLEFIMNLREWEEEKTEEESQN
jgi:hypothetical protein